MRSTEELLQLRQQAIALRRAGKSRRQIKEALGSMSNTTLSWALEGEPPPEWTRRPRAKDAVRARQGTARKGPRLRGDRHRTRRLQELNLTLGQGHADAAAPDLSGIPQALRRGGPEVLGGRAPGPRGGPAGDHRRRDRGDRPAQRSRAPDHWSRCLLVRRSQRQTATTFRPSRIRQQ